MYRTISSGLRNISLAAAIGLITISAPGMSQAAGNAKEIRECVRQIAFMERKAARDNKGHARRLIIAELGKIKMACMDGKLDYAYNAAARLRPPPQQASASN